MLGCFIVGSMSIVEMLTGYIDNLSMTLKGHTDSLVNSISSILAHKPDIVYIDIACIQDHNVEFALLKQLCSIVVLSDTQDEAFEAFEYQAFDYLVKPVSYSRFITGVEKYNGIKMRTILDAGNGPVSENEYFFIKVDLKGFREVMIRYGELLYVEAMQNYVVLHMVGGVEYLSYTSLKEMEDYLPGTVFSRIHKSYIINDRKIMSIEGNSISLDNAKQKLLIGSTYRKSFLEKKKRKMPRSVGSKYN
jgi:two-component system LytT family response regulator